jgi:hypothetical protein
MIGGDRGRYYNQIVAEIRNLNRSARAIIPVHRPHPHFELLGMEGFILSDRTLLVDFMLAEWKFSEWTISEKRSIDLSHERSSSWRFLTRSHHTIRE